MQSGKLDKQITIQALTTSQNDFGETVNSYSDLATVWAYIISQRGAESFESARVNARETIRVKIRYRDDLTHKHRIVYNSVVYNIVYLDETMIRQGELWLTCEVNGAD